MTEEAVHAGQLQGKVALITGGNSGIGLATARAFIREGADVIVTGRNAASLDQVQDELGKRAWSLRCDQSRLADLDELIARIRERYPALDIVFANAGISGSAPVQSASEEHFDQIFNTNARGVFFLVQKVAPYVRRGGSIILNSSTSAYVGLPGNAAYSGSKAAVRAFARSFSADLIEQQVRVNVVTPGAIDTPIFGRTRPDPVVLDRNMKKVRSMVPIERIGRAEEVAEVVVFLASNASSYLFGAEVVVDGGITEAPLAAAVYRN